MREEEVRRYAELMEKWDIRSLTVTDRDSTISMERGSRGAASGMRRGSSEAAGPAGVNAYNAYGNALADGRRQPEDSETEEQDRRTENDTRVSSPLVGVFYAAPAENADPFVSVGDTVKKGDTLCIIEAMKLMNEVRAEQDGVISKVCAANGQVVEFGTELFRIGRV